MDSWRVVQVGDWGTHPGASGKHTTPIAVIKGVGSMPLYVAAEVTDGRSSLILKLRANELTGEWGVVALQLRDELHGEELTGKFLRTLPLAKLCNEATPMIYERFNYGDLFGTGQIKGLPDVPPEVIEQWPNGDKDLVFKWVSTIYEGALAANLPPTKTVGEKFGVAYSKAIHLVRRARDAGVLTVSSVTGPKRTKDKTSGKNKTQSRTTREDHNQES